MRKLVATALAVALAVAFPCAQARPPANPDPVLSPWYESLKVPHTMRSCCGLADCKVVKARQTPNGYEVDWNGDDKWQVVPARSVKTTENSTTLELSNPTGGYVACRAFEGGFTIEGVQYNDGDIICFIRPAES